MPGHLTNIPYFCQSRNNSGKKKSQGRQSALLLTNSVAFDSFLTFLSKRIALIDNYFIWSGNPHVSDFIWTKIQGISFLEHNASAPSLAKLFGHWMLTRIPY